MAVVDGRRDGMLAGWAQSGPRPIRAGDGWWLRDEQGVHLTSLLLPGGSMHVAEGLEHGRVE